MAAVQPSAPLLPSSGQPASSPARQTPAGAMSRASTPPPRQAPPASTAAPASAQKGRQGAAGDALPAVRSGFVWKVYGILSAQLAFTVVVSAAVTLNDHLREPFLAFGWGNHSGLFSWGLFAATAVVLFLLDKYKQEVPMNYALLAGFTLLNSMSLSLLLALVHETLHHEGDELILQAAGITLVIFLALTAYAFKSGKDFEFMGAFLHVSLLGLVVAGFAGHFFKQPLLDAACAWLGALVFSGFIVYDTWKVSRKYGPDDYILATIDLYLDVVNLFVDILRSLLQREKEE